MQALGDDHEQLIEAVGDAIILADTNGIIRLWNQAAERLFGFAVAEALGRSLQLDTSTARATHVYKTKRNALLGNACGLPPDGTGLPPCDPADHFGLQRAFLVAVICYL